MVLLTLPMFMLPSTFGLKAPYSKPVSAQTALTKMIKIKISENDYPIAFRFSCEFCLIEDMV